MHANTDCDTITARSLRDSSIFRAMNPTLAATISQRLFYNLLSGLAISCTTDHTQYRLLWLEHVPNILSSMTKFATCYTCRKGVIADGDLFVDDRIGEGVGAFRHCSNKDTDTLLRSNRFHILADSYKWSVKTGV